MKQITEFAATAKEMLAAYGNCGSPRQQKAADALADCIKTADQFKATAEQVQAARAQYATDEMEVDDDASTSPGEDGVWVSAWLWVGNPS